MFGDLVGGPHPPLLSPGAGIHPLFRPRALAVAPPHEGYQRADHPLVSGITALQIQGDPQAGDTDDCSRLPLQKWVGGLQAGRLQNEEHLCLIAVIGVERPDKATVEREFGERRSGDSGAWTVRVRQPE